MPMPRRSTSLELRSWDLPVAPKPPRFGLIGVGAEMGVAEGAAFWALASASACSASGSYPSFSTRSASSLAFRSASSKSMSLGATFLAPSFGAFLAPRTLPFLAVPAEEVFRVESARMAVGAGDALLPSEADSGDFERLPFAFAPAFRNGDPVRLTTGGVPVREGGLLGRLIDGLSHEEKKSSSWSPAGVLLPSDGVPAGRSVMTTSPGYLNRHTVSVP